MPEIVGFGTSTNIGARRTERTRAHNNHALSPPSISPSPPSSLSLFISLFISFPHSPCSLSIHLSEINANQTGIWK